MNFPPEFVEVSDANSSKKDDAHLLADEQFSCFDATICFPENEEEEIPPPFKKKHVMKHTISPIVKRKV